MSYEYISPRSGDSMEESYLYCDKCGRAMKEGIEFGILRICPECFGDTTGEERHRAGYYQCSRCGEWVKDLYIDEDDVCDGCYEKEE